MQTPCNKRFLCEAGGISSSKRRSGSREESTEGVSRFQVCEVIGNAIHSLLKETESDSLTTFLQNEILSTLTCNRDDLCVLLAYLYFRILNNDQQGTTFSLPVQIDLMWHQLLQHSEMWMVLLEKVGLLNSSYRACVTHHPNRSADSAEVKKQRRNALKQAMQGEWGDLVNRLEQRGILKSFDPQPAGETPTSPYFINLTVRSHLDQSFLHFKIKTSTRLEKLMHVYCQRQNVPRNVVVFVFDGDRINGMDTAANQSMNDGDIIVARFHQTSC